MHKWFLAKKIGYEPIVTDMWDIYTQREGTHRVENTTRTLINHFRDNYRALAEISIILNHKKLMYEKVNELLSREYNCTISDTREYITEGLNPEDKLKYNDLVGKYTYVILYNRKTRKKEYVATNKRYQFLYEQSEYKSKNMAFYV